MSDVRLLIVLYRNYEGVRKNRALCNCGVLIKRILYEDVYFSGVNITLDRLSDS